MPPHAAVAETPLSVRAHRQDRRHQRARGARRPALGGAVVALVPRLCLSTPLRGSAAPRRAPFPRPSAPGRRAPADARHRWSGVARMTAGNGLRRPRGFNTLGAALVRQRPRLRQRQRQRQGRRRSSRAEALPQHASSRLCRPAPRAVPAPERTWAQSARGRATPLERCRENDRRQRLETASGLQHACRSARSTTTTTTITTTTTEAA
jgi:hypothetical protein